MLIAAVLRRRYHHPRGALVRDAIKVCAGSLLVACGAPAGAPTLEPAPFVALPERTAPRPTDNPLRGFFTYEGEPVGDFATSLEFFYIGLAELMLGPASFAFDAALEPRLNAIAARGRQAILRVYLDYPGNPPHQVPGYLVNDCGAACVTFTRYTSHGGGESPDYDNPHLVAALASFIAAFGERYDGDPRLAFVQVGLLGYWGEWHTYPEEHLMASAETRTAVLEAFDAAFDATHIVVSADALAYDDFAAGAFDVGFHDDDFGNSTVSEPWGYHARLVDRGRQDVYLTQSVGGEVQPDIQHQVLADDGAAAALLDAVRATHASWLLFYALFDSLSEDERARARAIASEMGYVLRVVGYRAAPGGTSLSVQLENRGVAPFPYPWELRLRITPEGGAPFEVATDWDIRQVPPRMSRTFRMELASPLPSGPFALALRLVQPLAGGRPVIFANETHDGPWVVFSP